MNKFDASWKPVNPFLSTNNGMHYQVLFGVFCFVEVDHIVFKCIPAAKY